jgi:hypothetical protein
MSADDGSGGRFTLDASPAGAAETQVAKHHLPIDVRDLLVDEGRDRFIGKM